ncbi:MAG: site-specific integrase [Bacteroidetes bacterium]|nr:site-specific integrase [Bacteroidota bacterium]
MTTSVKVFLRSDNPKKDGSAGIYLRFLLNRKKIDLPIGKSIGPKNEVTIEKLMSTPKSKRSECYYWNKQTGKVTNGCGIAESLNSFIASERGRAEKIILDYGLRGKKITRELFKAEFSRKNENHHVLAKDYFIDLIEEKKGSYSSETIRSYRSIITKMEKFKPGLLLNDITSSFLVNYEIFMLKSEDESGKGNQKSTIANNLKVIKTMVNVAISKGDLYTESNPFAEFKIKKAKGESQRNFIEPHELELLEKAYYSYKPLLLPIEQISPEQWKERENKGILTPSEYNTLRNFLFACYTGLRFTDLKNLKYSDLKKKNIRIENSSSFEERDCIEIDMHKTGFPVRIPLFERANNLINSTQKEGLIFRVISNQKTNECLKSVIKKVGIAKKITFHCARHTCATLALMNGLPDKFIQKILGHRESKTTEIYTHITNDYIFKQSAFFEKKLEEKSLKKKVEMDAKSSFIEKLMQLDPSKMEKLNKLLEIL